MQLDQIDQEEHSYNSQGCYFRKCHQANILPLSKRFDFNDLILFHKIFYQDILLELPNYLKFLDDLCIVSDMLVTSAPNLFKKSFCCDVTTFTNRLQETQHQSPT